MKGAGGAESRGAESGELESDKVSEDMSEDTPEGSVVVCAPPKLFFIFVKASNID